MKNFAYQRAADGHQAVQARLENSGARYLGGGTNLVDLMRENLEQPELLVDVSRLNTAILPTPEGGLSLGAGAKNTAVAENKLVRQQYPLVSEAILFGASGQIRNMASVAGNLLQRTRCHYFYDQTTRCNKRQPGAGCDALEGFNRIHCVLGGSPSCIATHPSDLCVALAALDAVVQVEGPEGKREIPFLDFHLLPGEHPEQETSLGDHELITAVVLPANPVAAHSKYTKVRDRASYAFALVSVAAALEVKGGVVQQVRLALGGVAPKPWRALEAEAALQGQPASRSSFEKAAALALQGAQPLEHNAFKIELAQRVLVNTLEHLL